VRPVVVALLVLTGAVLAAAPAGAATGYAVLADIPAGPGTLELGVDPSLSRLYVSTVDGLEVVDTTTRRVLTQGPVVSPGFLAVDAAAHRVYVTHAGSGTVSVMDGMVYVAKFCLLAVPHSPKETS